MNVIQLKSSVRFNVTGEKCREEKKDIRKEEEKDYEWRDFSEIEER